MSDVDILKLFKSKIPLSSLAPYENFQLSDGVRQYYRRYGTSSRRLILLLHGISASSKYMVNLARFLSQNDFADVVTPDLRGHHASQLDLQVTEQDRLLRDLQETREFLCYQKEYDELWLCGHSMGGGLALRVLEEGILTGLTGAIAVAPSTGGGFENYRPIYKDFVRIEGDWTQVRIPKVLRSGDERLRYHKSFFDAVQPTANLLSRLKLNLSFKSLEIVVGENDELVDPTSYSNIFKGEPRAHIKIFPGMDHMNCILNPKDLEILVPYFKNQMGEKVLK